MNAKAEAESLGIEIELKNKMLAELRADLNKSKKKNEDLQAQNDQLVRATHKSEEKDAKVTFLFAEIILFGYVFMKSNPRDIKLIVHCFSQNREFRVISMTS